eukprot:6488944-Amphidinium_carterae.1
MLKFKKGFVLRHHAGHPSGVVNAPPSKSVLGSANITTAVNNEPHRAATSAPSIGTKTLPHHS